MSGKAMDALERLLLPSRHPATVDARGREPITTLQLSSYFDWGSFPRTMRRHYLAQRGRCPYCDELLPLYPPNSSGNPATWDHVVPRIRGGGGHPERNKVLAHYVCNSRKSGREPSGCERFYCWITNTIAEALHPR